MKIFTTKESVGFNMSLKKSIQWAIATDTSMRLKLQFKGEIMENKDEEIRSLKNQILQLKNQILQLTSRLFDAYARNFELTYSDKPIDSKDLKAKINFLEEELKRVIASRDKLKQKVRG